MITKAIDYFRQDICIGGPRWVFGLFLFQVVASFAFAALMLSKMAQAGALS